MIRTKTGLLIAHKCTRVVHGKRGSYVEIEPESIVSGSILVPEDCRWRFSDYWRDRVYYREFRTIDSAYTKVYLQVEEVAYANYKVGYYYVAKGEVDGQLEEQECQSTPRESREGRRPEPGSGKV